MSDTRVTLHEKLNDAISTAEALRNIGAFAAGLERGIQAVLDLHQPSTLTLTADEIQTGKCGWCDSRPTETGELLGTRQRGNGRTIHAHRGLNLVCSHDVGVLYPCPTVAAVADAFGITEAQP